MASDFASGALNLSEAVFHSSFGMCCHCLRSSSWRQWCQYPHCGSAVEDERRGPERELELFPPQNCCSLAQEAHLVSSETGSSVHSVRMCVLLSQAGSSLSKGTEVLVGYMEKSLRASMSDGVRFGLTLSSLKATLPFTSQTS